MDKIYYVYVWMTDAPYYVGKGKGKRARNPKRNFGQMRPDTHIIFFRQNLYERAARRIEDLLVEKWGRKGIDPGGILENRKRPRDSWPHGDWHSKAMNDPELKAHLRQKSIEWFSDPENRKKKSEETKKGMAESGAAEKLSKSLKKYFSDPKNRKKKSEAVKKILSTPEWRKSQSERLKAKWKDPEYRAMMVKRKQDPEYRKKVSESIKRTKRLNKLKRATNPKSPV